MSVSRRVLPFFRTLRYDPHGRMAGRFSLDLPGLAMCAFCELNLSLDVEYLCCVPFSPSQRLLRRHVRRQHLHLRGLGVRLRRLR